MAGIVYALATPSMPGIVAIGATRATPARALAEANASDAWRAPEPYALACHVEVDDALAAERAIQALLVARRVHPRRAFYRATTDEARGLMALMGRAGHATGQPSQPSPELGGSSGSSGSSGGAHRAARPAIDAARRATSALAALAAVAAAVPAAATPGWWWQALLASTRFVAQKATAAAATARAAAKILARLVAVLS
jgi:hypothetical protein